MNCKMRLTGGLASEVVALAILLISTPVRADDDDAIDYRQHIMRTMGEQTAAITMIAQRKVGPDNLVTHLRILAVTVSMALKAFQPRVLGGRAKPELWTNWADFEIRMNELSGNIAALSKAASAGGFLAVEPKIQASLTCQGCHDAYKLPLDK